MKPPSLTIYVPDLSGGGLERLQIDLAPLFAAAGFSVTFLLTQAKGALLNEVPAGCRMLALHAGRQLTAFLPLVRYLRRDRPEILIAHTEHTAIMALWACSVARCATRVIVCQHNTASAQSRRRTWQFRILLVLLRLFLWRADRIVAVSAGVADDLVAACKIDRSRITVIHNGVVTGNFYRNASLPVNHPWFGTGVPVIVAAGRLVEQKDFATLIRAFADVLRSRDTRLVLLGDGPLRESLQNLAGALGVADKVDMPGFQSNPLPFMRAAALVVLSSQFEGFGMVLAEALACGTPVVSTDCPHGPAEILEHGRYGRLVPIKNPRALGVAMLEALDSHPSRQELERRGRDFSLQTSADRYVGLFNEVLAARNAS